MQFKTRFALALVIGLISTVASIYYTLPYMVLVSSFVIGLLMGFFIFSAIFVMTGKEFWERQMRKMDKREKRERELNKIRQEARASEIARQEVKDEFQRQKRQQREGIWR